MPARLGAGVARWALTVRLFHPLHLDGLCGAVHIVFLQVGWYCPQKNTVLTHRLLALRHVIPGWVAAEIPRVYARERFWNQQRAGDICK